MVIDWWYRWLIGQTQLTPISQDRETLTFRALLYLNVAVCAQVCRLFCVVYMTLFGLVQAQISEQWHVHHAKQSTGLRVNSYILKQSFEGQSFIILTNRRRTWPVDHLKRVLREIIIKTICARFTNELKIVSFLDPLASSKFLGPFNETFVTSSIDSQLSSSGTFCDSDSECHSTDEELSCREQPDISRFSRVCMAKLGEGATCGHSSLFDLFRSVEDVSNYCKKGLVCRTVG